MESVVCARRLVAIMIIATIVAPYFIPVPDVAAQTKPKIVFDMSHGQYNSKLIHAEDGNLTQELKALGYDVVWAMGGLNDTILADADALIIGSIYGDANGFAATEIEAVAEWFNASNKFLWVAGDSDYGGAYINNNMTAILKAVGSHVYPEPTQVQDAHSNCGAAYRVVANKTGTSPAISSIVAGVQYVLMHGPTLLYGSTSGDGNNSIALETGSIGNVTPILYYGAAATIVDGDLIAPVAHNEGDTGSFVAMTVEKNAGRNHNNILMVSGASPYGDYQPMYSNEYHGVGLNGSRFVIQAIQYGMNYGQGEASTPMDMTLILAGVAVVVVVIIVVVLLKRK